MDSITNFNFSTPAYSGSRNFAFLVNVNYFGGFGTTSEIAAVLKISNNSSTDANRDANGNIFNVFVTRTNSTSVGSGLTFTHGQALSSGTYYVRVYAITQNFTGTRSIKASVIANSVF